MEVQPGSAATSIQAYASQGEVINEEELFAAVTDSLLSEENPSLGQSFQQHYQAALSSGASAEDGTKLALQEMVQQEIIPESTAEIVHGAAFRAAQLDDNHQALYDGRGSESDPTIATADIQSAQESVKAILGGIESGSIAVEGRALSTPSNGVQNTSGVSGPVASGVGGGEFLWKPTSESDGNLVVLLPSQLTGQVESAGIYSSVPPTQENQIAEGRFSGDTHNGGRAHFRFDGPGGSYPDGAYVVATLSDGRNVSFQIGESSDRNVQ